MRWAPARCWATPASSTFQEVPSPLDLHSSNRIPPYKARKHTLLDSLSTLKLHAHPLIVLIMKKMCRLAGLREKLSLVSTGRLCGPSIGEWVLLIGQRGDLLFPSILLPKESAAIHKGKITPRSMAHCFSISFYSPAPDRVLCSLKYRFGVLIVRHNGMRVTWI